MSGLPEWAFMEEGGISLSHSPFLLYPFILPILYLALWSVDTRFGPHLSYTDFFPLFPFLRSISSRLLLPLSLFVVIAVPTSQLLYNRFPLRVPL